MELEEIHYVVDKRVCWKAAKSDSVTEEENLIKSKGGCWKHTSYDFFFFPSAASFSSFSGGPNICPRCNKTVYFGKHVHVCKHRKSGIHLRRTFFFLFFYCVCVVCLQLRRCRLSERTGTGPVCAARGAARLWLPAATQRWETEPG